MPEPMHSLTPIPDGAERITLAEDLRLLADEAKDLAQAEFAFQKARAAYAGQASKAIVGLLVVALVFVFFAVMALVVGAVIALGPSLGLWGAMAAVTLALLLAAGICAGSAAMRMKRMKAVIADGPRKLGDTA